MATHVCRESMVAMHLYCGSVVAGHRCQVSTISAHVSWDQLWLQMDVRDQLQLQIIIYGINVTAHVYQGI